MDVLIIQPSPAIQRDSKDRTSTETSQTTIFSIYSMYGEDNRNSRTSWTRSPSPPSGPPPSSRFSKDAIHIPSVSLTLPDSHHNALFKTGDCAGTELAYHASEPPSQRSTVVTDGPARNRLEHTNAPFSASRSSLTSHVTPRPGSSFAGSSLGTASEQIFDDHQTSAGCQSHLSGSSTSSSNIPTSPKHRGSPSKKSFRSSRSSLDVHSPTHHFVQHSRSHFSIRDLPPLPPSRSSTPASYTSRRSPRSDSSPSETYFASPGSWDNAAIPSSPPPSSAVQNLTAQKQTPSPSKTSLVPSEGEDMDAFHVRSTYARLEVSGVKGDGYEEGVERTRARLGANRESHLNADAALSDGSEKNGDLDPRELQVLAGVDRYGFFALTSHDRLVRLDSAPLLKKLSRTRARRITDPPPATTLSSLPSSPPPLRETARTAKWTRMLKRDVTGGDIPVWRVRTSKESKLRGRTYKGIPDCWRSSAWELLMSRYTSTGPQQTTRLGEDYREALDKPSSYDVQIDLDVPRTICGHVMFRTRYGAGQRSLFHVLHSFSLRCSHCGYVQGMGPIAATFLNYFEPERVYASLVRLHDAYSLHSVFSPGFPGMLEAIYVQERLTETFMPDVYAAFRKHMVSTTSYATKWYITLFSNSVPFQMQLRFWDVFLLEGYDVFIAVAVAIVWVYRDHITAQSANFETVLSLLSSFFVPEDEDVLMSWIEKMLGDKKIRSNMHQWREEWRALIKSGKEATALL